MTSVLALSKRFNHHHDESTSSNVNSRFNNNNDGGGEIDDNESETNSSSQQQHHLRKTERTGHVIIPSEIGLPGTAASLLMIFFEEELQTAKEKRTARDANGLTALHLAVLKICPIAFVRELIIEHEIDVNCVDYEGGNTPLHLACEQKALEHTKLLLSHGADPYLMNGKGELADTSFLARQHSMTLTRSMSASFFNPQQQQQSQPRDDEHNNIASSTSPSSREASPFASSPSPSPDKKYSFLRNSPDLGEQVPVPHYIPTRLITERNSLFFHSDLDNKSNNNDNNTKRHLELIEEAVKVAKMEVAVPLVPVPWHSAPSACIKNLDSRSAYVRRKSSIALSSTFMTTTKTLSSVAKHNKNREQREENKEKKKTLTNHHTPSKPLSSSATKIPHPLETRSRLMMKRFFQKDQEEDDVDFVFGNNNNNNNNSNNSSSSPSSIPRNVNDGGAGDGMMMKNQKTTPTPNNNKIDSGKKPNDVEKQTNDNNDDDEEEDDDDIFIRSKKYYQLFEKSKKDIIETTAVGMNYGNRRHSSIDVVQQSLPVWFAIIPRVSEHELSSSFLVGGLVRFHDEFQFDGTPFTLSETQLYDEIFCARFSSTLVSKRNNSNCRSEENNNISSHDDNDNDMLLQEEDPIVLELFTATKDTSLPTVVRVFRDTLGLVAAHERKKENQRQENFAKRKAVVAARNAVDDRNSDDAIMIQTSESKAISLLFRFMRRLMYLGRFQNIITIVADRALKVKKFLRNCVHRSKFTKCILYYVSACFFRYALGELDKFPRYCVLYRSIATVIRSFIQTFSDQRFVSKNILLVAVGEAFRARQRSIMKLLKNYKGVPLTTVVQHKRERQIWSVSLEEIIQKSIDAMPNFELAPVISIAYQRDGMLPRTLLYHIRQQNNSRELFEDLARSKVRRTMIDIVRSFSGGRRGNYFREQVLAYNRSEEDRRRFVAEQEEEEEKEHHANEKEKTIVGDIIHNHDHESRQQQKQVQGGNKTDDKAGLVTIISATETPAQQSLPLRNNNHSFAAYDEKEEKEIKEQYDDDEDPIHSSSYHSTTMVKKNRRRHPFDASPFRRPSPYRQSDFHEDDTADAFGLTEIDQDRPMSREVAAAESQYVQETLENLKRRKRTNPIIIRDAVTNNNNNNNNNTPSNNKNKSARVSPVSRSSRSTMNFSPTSTITQSRGEVMNNNNSDAADDPLSLSSMTRSRRRKSSPIRRQQNVATASRPATVNNDSDNNNKRSKILTRLPPIALGRTTRKAVTE